MDLMLGFVVRRLLAFVCRVAARRSTRLHPAVRTLALIAAELM